MPAEVLHRLQTLGGSPFRQGWFGSRILLFIVIVGVAPLISMGTSEPREPLRAPKKQLMDGHRVRWTHKQTLRTSLPDAVQDPKKHPKECQELLSQVKTKDFTNPFWLKRCLRIEPQFKEALFQLMNTTALCDHRCLGSTNLDASCLRAIGGIPKFESAVRYRTQRVYDALYQLNPLIMTFSA
jgi:hypothetical protein